MTRRGGHAVVIGGSIAGLLAARVLAEHFDRVTILDREPPADGPTARKCVPQARHSHLLLPPGCRVISELLPGLFDEMSAAHPHHMDIARDMVWFHFGRWRPRFRGSMPTVMCTRPLLEYHIQRRVLLEPRVTLRGDCVVDGLVSEAGRIAGVTFRPERGAGAHERLDADFVVDASGRGSHLPEWLVALGLPAPETATVRIDLGYASRLYDPPPDFDLSWKFLVHYPFPPFSWRGGLIFNVENAGWSVSLNGYFRDYPPADEAGFLEFARSLPQPYIYEYLRRATPRSDISVYRIPSVRRVRYETMRGFPERLVVLGDAVCALNPMFGQGMTVAALGVSELRKALHAQKGLLEGLGKRVQRAYARRLNVPWFLTTTMDLRYPQTQGRRGPLLPLLHWYIDNLMETVSQNRYVCYQYYLVAAMLRGLGTLLKPTALLPVLWTGLRGALLGPRPARLPKTVLPTPSPRQGLPEPLD